jgi:hypothetical protein
VDALHTFKNEELDKFMAADFSQHCLDPKKRQAGLLVDLGVPGGNHGKTVI